MQTEELLRKLLLTGIAVLMDKGSPIQITLAVLVCGWAHVLHAVYKPWDVGTGTYHMQHFSLFVTTFVFTMGLLFKVQGVSQSSPAYHGLAVVMLFLCISFAACWSVSMVVGVVSTLVKKRKVRMAKSKNQLGFAVSMGSKVDTALGMGDGTEQVPTGLRVHSGGVCTYVYICT
jgi:hypothetical protein